MGNILQGTWEREREREREREEGRGEGERRMGLWVYGSVCNKETSPWLENMLPTENKRWMERKDDRTIKTKKEERKNIRAAVNYSPHIYIHLWNQLIDLFMWQCVSCYLRNFGRSVGHWLLCKFRKRSDNEMALRQQHTIMNVYCKQLSLWWYHIPCTSGADADTNGLCSCACGLVSLQSKCPTFVKMWNLHKNLTLSTRH